MGTSLPPTGGAAAPAPDVYQPPAAVAPGAPLAPGLEWLLRRAGLDDAGRDAVSDAVPAALAPGAGDPGLVAHALLEAGMPAEALRLVACALPPREGVWWAWVAARHAAQHAQQRAEAYQRARAQQPPPPPVPPDAVPRPPKATALAALAAVERWIAQPTDEHRRAAWDAAQAAGLDTPAGCVASAVFFTGGSITPPHGPFVPPPAGIHTTMAATGALLAAIAVDAGRLKELAAAFVAQAVEVVRRLGGWDAAVGAARGTYDQQAERHAEASKPPKLPNA